jgi:hypothetical protein
VSFLFGQKDEVQEQTFGGVKERDFPTNQAALPYPIHFGTQPLVGSYMTPLFNDLAEPITRSFDAGSDSQEVVTGYNYFASFVLCLSMREQEAITEIRSNGERIWHGELTQEDAEGGAVNIATEYATFCFHFGAEDQAADRLLKEYAALVEGGDPETIKVPRYPGRSYVSVCRMFMGQSTTPPTLTFVTRSKPVVFPGPTSRHPIESTLAEVLFELATNPIIGAGRGLARIDAASFMDCHKQLLQEGAVFSPRLDEVRTFRAVAAELLPYFGAYLVPKAGRLTMGLIRKDWNEEDLPVITDADLLSPLQPEPGSYKDTWSRTRVAFTDRAREYKPNIAPARNTANERITGRYKAKEIDRQHVTSWAVASRLAAEISKANGTPGMSIPLDLSDSWAHLHPGDVVKVVSARLNCSAIVRLGDKKLSAPERGGVGFAGAADRTLTMDEPDDTPDLVPAEEPSVEPEDAHFRIAFLTEPQKGAEPDGLLVAASRPHGMITRGEIFAGWSDAGSFTSIGRLAAFQVGFKVWRWEAAGGSAFIVQIETLTPTDETLLRHYRNSSAGMVMVIARWVDVEGVLVHQLVPCWARIIPGSLFEPDDDQPTRWNIQIQAGEQGSEDFTAALPSLFGFLGREQDFGFLRTHSLFFEREGANHVGDTDEMRIIALAAGTPTRRQPLGDAPAITFDRPAGTLSLDWGLPIRAWQDYAAWTGLLPGLIRYFRLADTDATMTDSSPSAQHGTLSALVDGGASEGVLDDNAATALVAANEDAGNAGNEPDLALGEGSVELWVKAAAKDAGTRAAGLVTKRGAWGIYQIEDRVGFYDFTAALDLAPSYTLAQLQDLGHFGLRGAMRKSETAFFSDGAAWSYLVLSWKASVARLVDGQGRVLVTGAMAAADQADPVTVGASAAGDEIEQFLNGALDEVAIYESPRIYEIAAQRADTATQDWS